MLSMSWSRGMLNPSLLQRTPAAIFKISKIAFVNFSKVSLSVKNLLMSQSASGAVFFDRIGWFVFTRVVVRSRTRSDVVYVLILGDVDLLSFKEHPLTYSRSAERLLPIFRKSRYRSKCRKVLLSFWQNWMMSLGYRDLFVSFQLNIFISSDPH